MAGRAAIYLRVSMGPGVDASGGGHHAQRDRAQTPTGSGRAFRLCRRCPTLRTNLGLTGSPARGRECQAIHPRSGRGLRARSSPDGVRGVATACAKDRGGSSQPQQGCFGCPKRRPETGRADRPADATPAISLRLRRASLARERDHPRSGPGTAFALAHEVRVVLDLGNIGPPRDPQRAEQHALEIIRLDRPELDPDPRSCRHRRPGSRRMPARYDACSIARAFAVPRQVLEPTDAS
jgi:hypothetical protein